MAPDAKEIRQAEREEKRNEKERTREEKTKAYIALEDEQKALYKDIADLEEQFPLTITIPGAGPTRTISPEAQGIIDAKHARIDQIEKDLEKIYNSTLGFVVGRSKKQRLEDMVAAASGAEAAKAAPKEQIAELKTDTLALAAQHLMAAGLLPGDLKGDEPKRSQAARLVGREGASPAELSAFADELQPAYDIEMNIKKAAEDMEKGVVVGRTMDAIKEVAGNPAKMGGAALGLLGAWLLYSAVGHGPSDGAMKWIKGILGVAGLGVGIGVVSGALSYKNIGLGDAVEKLTGVRADEAFSTESMDKVRHLFDGMPSTDTDAVDDFIRIMDAPVENVADMFRAALKDGATEVEAARLLGNGLSSKEKKFVDEGSLYTSCSWFFLKCYEQGLAKGDLATTTDEKTKLLLGLDWSKKNFKGHQMGTAVAAFELVRLGSGTGTVETTGTPETDIANPALAKLEKDVSGFGEVLEKTTRADVYLINGYPVRYNHTDAGGHIFTDVLDPTQLFTEVKADSSGDTLEFTLRGIGETAATRAKALFTSKYQTEIPDIATRLKYRPSNRGLWELDPKEPRSKPKGLPNHRADEKLNLVFYVDPTKQETRVDLDATLGHEPPYKDVAEVKKQFEKELLKGLVLENTSHVMLGVDFKVLDYVDNTAPLGTTVLIEYGDNAQGKLVYENDALTSYELKPDAALETVWDSTAEKRVADFLNTPLVQTELLKATGSFTPGTLDGWMASIGKFFGNGIQWLKDDSIMAQFHNDWEKQVITKMKELVYHPTTGLKVDYVNTLFKTSSAPATAILKKDFKTKEDAFFAGKLTQIRTGVVSATVVPEKEPDFEIEWTDLTRIINEKGQDRVALALSPLKYEKPTASTSFSWTVVNGVYNFAMGDATREHEADQIIKVYMQELATNIRRRATPPAKVTMNQVEEEIEKIEYKAQGEALTYWNTNDQAAVEKMMLSPIKNQPAYAQWEGATKTVASYLANSLKWENYGFMPNPENMAEIMKVWYERIGNAATPPVSTTMGAVKIDTADQYAKYFIWETWARFGGNKDYSLDALYSGKIESVSDSQFKAEVTGFKSAVQPYTVWMAVHPSEVRPAVPGMESSLEKYKETEKKAFEEWFDTYAAVPVWNKPARYGPQMFKWNQIFKESAMARFGHFEQFGTSIMGIDSNVKELKRFVMVEKYIIYETLIMEGLEPEHWGNDIDRNVIKKFWTYFTGVTGPGYVPGAPRTTPGAPGTTPGAPGTTPGAPGTTPDLPGYTAYIKKNMAIQLNEFHRQPNWPGIPFA